MRPVLYVTIAMILYAITNLIMEQKLAKFDIVVILIGIYTVMFPAAILRWTYLKTTGGEAGFPEGKMLVLLFVMGVIFFFADYLYLGAYQVGGSLMSVTTVVIMLPVFASALKIVTTGVWPNGRQIAGYVLAIGAIYLVGKGN